MNKPHFALWILVLLFSVFSLASCPASADPTVAWFPYANCQNWTFVPNGPVVFCPPWGGPDMGHYLKRPLYLNLPNPIWNMERVYYTRPLPPPYPPTVPLESWYDVSDSDYTWVMALNNPGQSAITLKIELYNGNLANNGQKVDESTLWSKAGGLPDLALIKQTGNDSLVWDSANDLFQITVPAMTTKNVACYGTTDSVFTTPPPGYQYHPSIKVTQEEGADFLATIRGQNVGRYRTGTGTSQLSFLSQRVPMFNFSYNAIYLPEYTPYAGQYLTNVITLPWYRETYNSDDGVSEWSTHVSLVNAKDSSDIMFIEVLDKDGVRIGSGELLSLSANQRFTFLPSQYVNNTTSQAGIVKIYGTYPVAVAMQMRFPKSIYSVSNQKTRISNTQTAEFFIN